MVPLFLLRRIYTLSIRASLHVFPNHSITIPTALNTMREYTPPTPHATP